MTYMTVHDPDYAGEAWQASGVDVEKRFRLGSEVNSLSLSRSASSEKHDPRDFSLNLKLLSNVKWDGALDPFIFSDISFA